MRHLCVTLIVFDVPFGCVVSPYKNWSLNIKRYVKALSRHMPVTLASGVVPCFPFICFRVGPIMDRFSDLFVEVSLPLPQAHFDLSRMPRLTPEKRTIWFSLVPSKHAHRDPMCSVIWILYGSQYGCYMWPHIWILLCSHIVLCTDPIRFPEGWYILIHTRKTTGVLVA